MGARGSSAKTSRKGRSYRCYLVRCRLEEDAGEGEPTASRGGAWRFTVEQVRPDAARRSFTSIHDVAAYIDAELAQCAKVRKEDQP